MDNVYSPTPWWVYPALAGILFLAGLSLGWRMHAPRPAPVEAYAASVVQADGSLLLERQPNASAVAPMQIPAGAKVQRLIQLRIKPHPAPSLASAPTDPAVPLPAAPAQAVNCQPLTLDLALVDQADHTQRVIASSPDGLILGGLDIPVAPRPATRDPPRWAAGLSYDSARRSGLWLERDLGPLRTGVALRQDDNGGLRGELRVGIRF